MFSYAARRPLTPTLSPEYKGEGAARRPLTPTLSPEYRGEGARIDSLARSRERAGVREEPWLNHVAGQVAC